MAKSWKTAKVAGYNVRMPSSMSPSSPKVREAISRAASHKGLRRGAGCDIVLFKAKTARPVAVQRCAGSNARPKFAAGGKKAMRKLKAARCVGKDGMIKKRCRA